MEWKDDDGDWIEGVKVQTPSKANLRAGLHRCILKLQFHPGGCHLHRGGEKEIRRARHWAARIDTWPPCTPDVTEDDAR